VTMARLILSLNGQTLAEYNLSKERYTIGRLTDNDIRIDSPAISGHHSLVINILNDAFLEDLNSTNGTYVNGKLIKKHALMHGDVITMGHHQLRFVDEGMEDADQDMEGTIIISPRDVERMNAQLPPAAREPLPAAVMPGIPARLQVLTGVFAGRELELKKPVTTLGRTGVQVIAVTRRRENYTLVVVEPGKAGKPPTVNGEAVAQSARMLHDNDVIEVAGVKMSFFTS
jgi:pSer/pThr/pTyr-binding forkhead associated (FHA) protein